MRILVTDNSERVRKTLIKYLDLEIYFDAVFESQTVDEAKRIMQNIKIEVVLLNLQLEDQSTLELMNFSQSQAHKPLVILCSTYGTPIGGGIKEKFMARRLYDESSALLELKKFIRSFVKNENPDSSKKLLKQQIN